VWLVDVNNDSGGALLNSLLNENRDSILRKFVITNFLNRYIGSFRVISVERTITILGKTKNKYKYSSLIVVGGSLL
jgi:hypothetical protein